MASERVDLIPKRDEVLDARTNLIARVWLRWLASVRDAINASPSIERGEVESSSGTPVTLVTLPAVAGSYRVFACVAGSGNASNLTAEALVLVEGTDARISSDDGGQLALTLSGLDVQATQTSGSAQTITYRVVTQ